MPTFSDLLGPEPAAPPSAPTAPGAAKSPGTFSDLLGPPPESTATLPTDDFGRPVPGSSPEQDHYIANSGIGHVLNAFGQGAAQGWGTDALGFDPQTEASLKKSGIFADAAKGQGGLVRAFNEALLRPAAAALDAAARVPSALFAGAQSAAAQAGIEVGAPGLGRDIAALPEAFMGGMPEGVPHGPVDLPAARDLGVIGQPESVWQGTTEPLPAATDSAVHANVAEAQAAANENVHGAGEPAPAPAAEPTAAEPPPAAPEPAAPMDVHGLARQIAPETFSEYDALQAHQNDLRQQISDQTDALQQQAAAQAPNAAKIADLEERLQDTTPRLAKKYQAQLDALRPDHDAFLNDDFTMGALTRDTPEIGALRQQLLETDYRMRDLAPEVTDAYQKASAQMPAVEEGAAEPAQASAEPEPQQATAPAAAAPTQPEPPAQGELAPVANPGEPVRIAAPGGPEIPASIAEDVSKKLQAAGRPADESDAAGQVTEAMWQTRANAFEGRKGTAQEMYAREAPDIRAGRETMRARQTEFAQRGRNLEQRPQREATVPASEVRGVPPWVHEGKPGMSIEAPTGSESGALRTLVYRNDEGKPVGSVTFALESESSGITNAKRIETRKEYASGLTTFVSPEMRRQGVATRMYDYLRDQGFNVDEAAGKGDLTPDGAAFTNERSLRQGAQGKIRLAEDGRSVITLMKSANASTFMHEMGHDWLERMMRDGVDSDAPQRMRDDAGTVRSYLGLNEGDAIPTKAHEKFARSFERYLMEGRAPTQALANVFAKFKAWLTGIYQTAAKLRAPITPDIRDVFDRLLTENPDRQASIVPEAAKEVDGDLFNVTPKGQLPSQPAGKPTPLYPKLPKEPIRLIAFLRKRGGVRDEGGWIDSIIGGSKARPGLISATGMTMDDATIAAHEHGYFPELGDRLPTHNELYDAIDRDMRGDARYSAEDSDSVRAYQDAIQHNNEVERMAREHDIDTTGMTREQFFEALSERVSFEKFAEEIRSLEESHEADFGEFASEARDWAEAHEGHWDSDQFYGIDGPRTERELEDAYGSQNAARSAGQGVSGGGEPGTTAGSAEPGEVSGGQGGRGAGDAGRAGEAAGDGERGSGAGQPAGGSGAGNAAAEQPANPSQPFGRPDGDLIDKAGNIRLDNLNQPEEVNRVIRDAAAANDDFQGARRGVVSDAQVLDLANALGMKASDLNRRTLGQAFNAEQIMAARKLLVDSATAVRAAAEKAATGSDAEVVAYGEAAARHKMIQEQVSGITAEAGRALRAFRMMGTEGDQVKALGDFLKQETGRDLFQMRREAAAVATLDDGGQLSKFLVDSQKPDFWDKFIEYYTNNLISGPETHTTYAAGNELLAVWKAIPETAAAAAVGSVREAFGAGGDRVYWGEVGAQLHGILYGQRDGFRAFVNGLKSGITEALPGEAEGSAQMSMFSPGRGRPGAIGGTLGEIVRLPSRGIAGIHSYFRTIGYAQAKGALAYRQAASEGLTGNAFDARVGDLTVNPPPDMMEAARIEANDQTMMGEGGDFTKALARLSNTRIAGVPLLKFVLPFVKVGSNVARQALMERSPLGLLDAGIRDNLMGRNGAVARDSQIGRIAVGSALGAVTFGLASQGLVTGSGPTDPKAAATWRLTGNQPYSVRIGDTWYAYHKLGPLGMIMGVAADLNEFGGAMDTHGADQVTALMAVSIVRNILDEGWMSGVSSAIQAITQPEQYGEAFIRNQGSTVLPFAVGLGQEARAIDPYARQARTLTDAFMAKIPGLSEQLMPRRDIWGQPVENPSDFGGTGLTSISERRVNNDPVNQAMVRLGINAGLPARKITGIPLSDQQYDDYVRVAGRMAKMRLDALVNTPGFQSLPAGIQTKVMTDTITNARRGAAELIKMQNPSIISQAVANKQSLLVNGRTR